MASKTLIVSASVVALAGVLAVANVLMTKAPATCPEAVTPSGAHNEPRNAAGFVRYCWPGMAACRCDNDRRRPRPTGNAAGDCYALEGYVACAPAPKPAADAGFARDVPRIDVGVARDLGSARDVVATVDVRPAVDTGPVVPPVSGVVAFQGAEGWGATATGGRGGRVIVVTNLNTSGPGSLRAAVDATGPRVVVFRVSGVIRDVLHITHGDLTIAGQTSPGGITVLGIDTTEENYCDSSCPNNIPGVRNVVIRFLRSRPAGAEFPDGLRLRYAKRVIVDHVSIGNAVDEAAELSFANSITVQNCIFGETIGSHVAYGGVLINYTHPAAGFALDNISLLRNAWVRIGGRYPEMSRESGSAAAGTTLHAQIVNSLIWDQRFFMDVNPTNRSSDNSAPAIHYQLDWIGTYSRAPSSNHYGLVWMDPRASGTTAYFNDNRSALWPNRQSWDLRWCCSDYNGEANARPSWGRTTPHPGFPTVTVMPATSVRAYAVASVGALPRDPMDVRLMSFVAANTIDTRANNVNPAGDALRVVANPPAAPLDSDSDGMPDSYESTHGTNPLVQDHNAPRGSITALDIYLDWVAAERVVGR